MKKQFTVYGTGKDDIEYKLATFYSHGLANLFMVRFADVYKFMRVA